MAKMIGNMRVGLTLTFGIAVLSVLLLLKLGCKQGPTLNTNAEQTSRDDFTKLLDEFSLLDAKELATVLANDIGGASTKLEGVSITSSTQFVALERTFAKKAQQGDSDWDWASVLLFVLPIESKSIWLETRCNEMDVSTKALLIDSIYADRASHTLSENELSSLKAHLRSLIGLKGIPRSVYCLRGNSKDPEFQQIFLECLESGELDAFDFSMLIRLRKENLKGVDIESLKISPQQKMEIEALLKRD
jgi:hypothetical protein